jgi:hypothetical protein
MNDWDAYLDDMTKAQRSDIGSGGQAADADLDAILAGNDLPLDADPALVSLAASLAAATDASALEQDVPRLVRDAYRDAFATSNPPFDRESARRRPMLRSFLNAKAAAVAVAAGGLSLGGLTAAYAGVLPDAAQNLAHHAIGAPAAQPHQPAGKPVGPDASGRAAYGLCTAWQHAPGNGKASNAPAFRNLITAAGGADQVDGYCAAVFAAKDGGHGKGHGHAPASHANHPTGKPSALPTQAATGHPTGKPSAMPTQAATGHPTGKPSSKPTQAATGHPTGTPSSAPTQALGGRSHAGSGGTSGH